MIKVIAEPGAVELVVRGSRFIAEARSAAERAVVDGVVAELRREHHRAAHVCFAYRLGLERVEEFSTDAGEPSGTAGKPMLDALRSFGVGDALVTVIRYFGGTKLGIRGLIDAYGGVARAALEAASVTRVAPYRRWRALVTYAALDALRNRVGELGGRFEALEYGAGVDVELAFPAEADIDGWLAGLTGGGALTELEELDGAWLPADD